MEKHTLNWSQVCYRIKTISNVADMKYIAYYLPASGALEKRLTSARRLLKRLNENQERLGDWANGTDRSEDWLDVARVMYWQIKRQKTKLEDLIETLEQFLVCRNGGPDE